MGNATGPELNFCGNQKKEGAGEIQEEETADETDNANAVQQSFTDTDQESLLHRGRARTAPASVFEAMEATCICGNKFLDDSKFCRKCGKERLDGRLDPLPKSDESRKQEGDGQVQKLEEEKAAFLAQQASEEKQRRLDELEQLKQYKRAEMRKEPIGQYRPANRYGQEVTFPAFEKGHHVPTLALINPRAGAEAGGDIMDIARRSPYYQDRFFNIIDVVKDKHPGGLLDVFREELNKAKDEAKAQGTRPRLISGGGDGTASFAIFIVFSALRAQPDRIENELQDTGNGFIWADDQLRQFFPAIAQMPLGSANDFGNILGWGQKYPGDRIHLLTKRETAARQLQAWISAVISPTSRVVNFDLWGIMPPPGQTQTNFKLAELNGRRGRCPNQIVNGRRELHLRKAGTPTPFFICLYFSAGFGAYLVARFQLNRRKTPVKNRAEYIRQALGIVMEPTPPQMHVRLNNVSIDCDEEEYFPPRRSLGNIGRRYREVGFYNVNWQAHAMHGADRADASTRLCKKRPPVNFNDGAMDMFRWKFSSLLKNPGVRLQTDKKKDMLLTYSGGAGKGLFFQWDGEARFAFTPDGKDFQIYVRQIMTVPVVLGPFLDESLTGNLRYDEPVAFSFSGDDDEAKEAVKRRILQSVRGELESEMNATQEDIEGANLLHVDHFPD